MDPRTIQLPMSHLWGVMTANLCGLNRDKLRDKRKRAGYYHNWVAWIRVTINWLAGVTITQFLWDFEASSVDYCFGHVRGKEDFGNINFPNFRWIVSSMVLWLDLLFQVITVFLCFVFVFCSVYEFSLRFMETESMPRGGSQDSFQEFLWECPRVHWLPYSWTRPKDEYQQLWGVW